MGELKRYKKQSETEESQRIAFAKGLGILFSIMLILTLTGCSSENAGEIVVLGKEPPEAASTVGASSRIKEGTPLSEQDTNFRAWIKSLRLKPPLPNKDQILHAETLWGPEGRKVEVSVQWFVNGAALDPKEGHAEEASVLSLDRFRSGDRIHIVASLIRPDGSVADSQRSLSTVIQNRPPELKGGLENLVRQDNALVGQVSYADPDGDRVSVKLLEGPRGLILEDGGSIRWPLSMVAPGEHKITLELLDERGLGFRASLPFSIGVENEERH